MKRLTRDHLFKNYGNLETLPDSPPLTVAPGEPFQVETVDTGHVWVMTEADMTKPPGPMAGNPCTGPVRIEGIRAGEVIAVTIKEIHVVGHCVIGVDEETYLLGSVQGEQHHFVRISKGFAHLPGGFACPIKPMFGCFGVVPSRPSPEPWHHGGNLDLPDICAGSTVHIRCQRDGAYFCCGDGHALQGDGEINGYSLEVSLEAVLQIDRSPYSDIETMIVETSDRFITVGVEDSFATSIRSAERSMTQFLSKSRKIDVVQAYLLASHVGDVRVGPLWQAVQEDQWSAGIPVPACVQLSKHYFAQ